MHYNKCKQFSTTLNSTSDMKQWVIVVGKSECGRIDCLEINWIDILGGGWESFRGSEGGSTPSGGAEYVPGWKGHNQGMIHTSVGSGPGHLHDPGHSSHRVK